MKFPVTAAWVPLDDGTKLMGILLGSYEMEHKYNDGKHIVAFVYAPGISNLGRNIERLGLEIKSIEVKTQEIKNQEEYEEFLNKMALL